MYCSETQRRSVFDSVEQNTNSTPSPTSSPVSSPSASVPPDLDDVSPPPYFAGSLSNQPGISSQMDSAHAPRSPSRRSSLAAPAYRDDEEEGEESMDLSMDDLPPPAIPPPFPLHTESGSNQDNNVVHNSYEDDDSDEDDEGDMSMTGEFGRGIVSRRRTISMAGRERRKSRMRSSITIPPSEAGEEPKEFTVSVDRPPPPEDDAFKALKAIANGNRSEDDDVASEDGEVDMDVSTAVTRLLAVRNSTDGQLPINNPVEDSFTSTDDSFDGADAGDRTVNVTNLMGSFRASDYGMDEVTSAASMVSAPIPTYPTPKPKPTPASVTASTSKPAPFVPASSSAIPVPVFNKSKSSVSATQGPLNASRAPSPAKPVSSRIPSPVKQSIKKFTAAFAPPFQPLKRPLAPSQDGPNDTVASPNKKRAVTAGASSSQRVPVPVVPAGTPARKLPPDTGLPTKARRPSGYYRKSLVGPSAQVEASVDTQHSASTSEQKSIARPVSPKKLSSSTAREISSQSLAIPSPTRGSPSPPSPAVKRRINAEPRVPDPITPGNARNDGVVESIEDIQAKTALLSPTAQNIDPGQWASAVHGDDIPQEDDLVS